MENTDLPITDAIGPQLLELVQMSERLNSLAHEHFEREHSGTLELVSMGEPVLSLLGTSGWLASAKVLVDKAAEDIRETLASEQEEGQVY